MPTGRYISAIGEKSEILCTKCFDFDQVVIEIEVPSGREWSILKCSCQRCDIRFEVWNFAKRFSGAYSI